jgi:hypothetical protein
MSEKTEKKITPQQRYHAKHKRRYVIDCFDTTEIDIIRKLDSMPKGTTARYIKNLIRNDFGKGGGNEQ